MNRTGANSSPSCKVDGTGSDVAVNRAAPIGEAPLTRAIYERSAVPSTALCTFVALRCESPETGAFLTAVGHKPGMTMIENPPSVSREEGIPGESRAETTPDASGTARIRSAVIWRSGSQIVGQLVMWSSTFLVLRLLTPGDYGLFAMTQVVVGLAQLMNGYSFASSLVQAETLDTKRAGQVFGFLIVMNGAIAIAQFIAAPYAAEYFHQPMLVAMLRVQCLLHLTTPFIIMPQALLSRSIDFRTQGRANLIAAAAGAITAPVCALAGLGVWTLVLAPLALFGTRALLLGLLGKWWIRPRFGWAGAGAMMGFGGTVLISDILWFVQNQADVFIAGRRFDAHMLGLYSEGLFLTQILVNKFVPALNEVAFPAYARMQADRSAVAWSFAKALSIIMLVSLPCYVGLAVVAGPLVLTVMGPKWADAIPLVQLLAFAMPFVTLHVLYPPATNALGRPTDRRDLVGGGRSAVADRLRHRRSLRTAGDGVGVGLRDAAARAAVEQPVVAGDRVELGQAGAGDPAIARRGTGHGRDRLRTRPDAAGDGTRAAAGDADPGRRDRLCRLRRIARATDRAADAGDGARPRQAGDSLKPRRPQLPAI